MRACTAQQLADYFAKQVMMGRGQWEVQLDPRDSEGVPTNIVNPPAGKSHDDSTRLVYVSIRITGAENGNS